MYKTSEIRDLFIKYFTDNKHQHIKSSSLMPHNDNSLLFTNAGMVQFKNVFLGLEQRDYKRAVSYQKCLRAGGKHNDLDNVGYTNRHHTFFEMLGNFSFGDYFKEQSIYYAYNFIHKILGIPKEKLIVTVYYNDEEAVNYWKKIAGFSDDRIIRINSSDNFWSMGNIGPCGPCTEIFYDYGKSIKGGLPGSSDEDGGRYTEIWNLVFMQYNQLDSGEKIKIKSPCIDTGMGLERIASVLQGVYDNYDIDIFNQIIKNIEELLKVKVDLNNKTSFKVIADHIRAVVFLITDGVLPSNEGRGYVLRRIIRRAIRHGYILNNKNPIFYKLVPSIVDIMKDAYPEIEIANNSIVSALKKEEEKFATTIHDGMKLLSNTKTMIKNNILPGDVAFKLYDTYGFPLDLTQDILKRDNIHVDLQEFESCMQKQKERSKQNWVGSGEKKDDEFWFSIANDIDNQFVGYDNLVVKGNIIKIVDYQLKEKTILNPKDKAFVVFDKTPFYAEGGGQVGDIGIITTNEFTAKVIDTQKLANKIYVHSIEVITGSIRLNEQVTLSVDEIYRRKTSSNHTATHILFVAMQNVIGFKVSQKGCLVDSKKIRVDIALDRALSKEEIIAIEREVNEIIIKNITLISEFMPYDQAISKGASFLLGENYPEIVRVISIKDNQKYYSIELCGGAHVKNTGEIGLFKITSEMSIKSGVRRIEAVTNIEALSYFQTLEEKMYELCKISASNNNNIISKISALITEVKQLKTEIVSIRKENFIKSLKINPLKINDINFISILVDKEIISDFKNIKDDIHNKYEKSLILLYTENNLKEFSFLISINNLSSNIDLSKLSFCLKEQFKIKCGGNKNLLQGQIQEDNINNFINIVKEFISQSN